MTWKNDKEKDYRYGEKWSAISRSAIKRCKDCCYCLKNKAEVTHHVRYQEGNKLLLDNVKIGVDVFPVCRKCHTILHSRKSWKVFKDSKYNCNSKEQMLKLELGFLIILSPVKQEKKR